MSLSTAPILTAPRARVNVVLRNFATLVCAGSAGVHAVLVPGHLRESVPLGAGFAGSAAGLLLSALLLRRVEHRWPMVCSAAVLATTAIAYVLSRTTGIPLLLTEPEQFDPLGLLTTTAELAAVLSCYPLLMTGKDHT